MQRTLSSLLEVVYARVFAIRVRSYHWRELPQVSFRRDKHQTFCREKLLLSRQTRLCLDKTHLLSRQRYACRDKHNFVATKVLSRQAFFCRDKRRVMILTAAPGYDKVHAACQTLFVFVLFTHRPSAFLFSHCLLEVVREFERIVSDSS